MLIELRPIESIRPYDKNPRVIDAAVDAVARSLKEFGWRQPIVVDKDGVIVVGHTRLKAAQKLGLTEVPVHVAHELSPEQTHAYRIADNQAAPIAEWDMELLPVELAELKDLGIDMTLLGFSDDDLKEMMAPAGMEGLIDADEVPEAPEDAITNPGNIWLLGEHKLLCGNSTIAGDVDRLMEGAKAALTATDPPYLVDYTGERPDRDGGNSGGKDWSAVYREVDIKDAEGFFRAPSPTWPGSPRPNSAIYCWHAHKRQATTDRCGRAWQAVAGPGPRD